MTKKKNTKGQSCGVYEKKYHLVDFIVSFIGKFLLKCDFDQCKVFLMEKMVQICQASKRKINQITIFLQEVPVCRQEYRRILVFPYFHIWHVAIIGYISFWMVATLVTSQNP
jgi:hypothetical protein